MAQNKHYCIKGDCKYKSSLEGEPSLHHSFSRCPLLSIAVPKNRSFTMCRILKPFIKHFDILGNAIEVLEKDCSLIPQICEKREHHCVPPYTVSQDQMSSPAMSIMLFLSEFGPSRAEKVKQKFKKPPWRLHHSIQLQNNKSSDVLGKQEFYFLSRSYPLWSVCTSPKASCHLRVNLFVRRYSAMVEFYRLVTGSEMESSKPGFCIFQLNTRLYEHLLPQSTTTELHNDNNVTFELALKQCPHINPFPLTDAYPTFPVTNLVSLNTILHNNIRPLTSTHHLVHDPDGNPVILYDTSTAKQASRDSLSIIGNPQTCAIRTILAASKKCIADKASVRSESLDSGRFSDFDTSCSTELDHCMAQLFPSSSFGKTISEESIHHQYSSSFDKEIHRISCGQLPFIPESALCETGTVCSTKKT